MRTATVFAFNGYHIELSKNTLEFYYRITFNDGRNEYLKELIKLPVSLRDNEIPHQLLQALHIILGISYYKIFMPPNMEVPYQLSSRSAEFWNTVFQKGLGEFLYTNKLPVSRIAQFTASSVSGSAVQKDYASSALLGIGGGKDSIVAGELLKSLDIPLTAFVIGTGEHLGQAKSVADVMGVRTLGVERTLDPRISTLSQEPGAYNGHVPISVVFALMGVLLAHLTNSAYVVVGNEASSSLPQAEWEGEPVNHQWSKSLQFERLFQNFVHEELVSGITYFSAIRPLSSVGVAKLFTRYPQYFEVFTSDNHVFRIDPSKRPNGRWGLESAKSLSSFILLAPWLSESDMHRIFTINFLDQPSLEKMFLELIGAKGHPPLDCVGTTQELTASLSRAYEQGKYLDSVLMKLAIDKNMLPANDLAPYLQANSEHTFPKELEDKLISSIKAGL